MHEAQRLATMPVSLYPNRIPAQIPVHAAADDDRPLSLPLVYHAVRVLHALEHYVTLQRCAADEALQRRLLAAAFLLIDRLVREEAAYATHNQHKKSSRAPKDPAEHMMTTSHRMMPRLLSPAFFMNGCVLRWKDLSLMPSSRDKDIPPLWSPKELLSQLQSWSSQLASSSNADEESKRPRIQLYDQVIINMIMEVIIKQQPDPAQAPLVAEHLLQFLLEDNDETTRLRPDSFTYGLILSAWSRSKLPQAGSRMEALVQDMAAKHGIPPSQVTYLILLRHYASQGNVERFTAVLQQMNVALPGVDHLRNIQVRSELVFCHCHGNRNIHAATEILYQMLRDPGKNTPETRARDVTIQSVFNVLASYRTAVLSPRSSREAIRYYTEAAERLVHEILQNEFLLTVPKGDRTPAVFCPEQVKTSLSFIYACAGRLDLVQAMFDSEVEPSYFRYMALVRAYGQHHRPDEANQLLHRLLNEAPYITSFTTHIFSSVMDAWATAAHPQALEKALDVMTLMETHPRCIELEVRPCPAIFNNLLQILSNLTTATSTTVTTARPSFLGDQALQYAMADPNPDAPSSSLADMAENLDNNTLLEQHSPTSVVSLDTCRLSIAILDEMERRSQKNGIKKPTTITYSIIIKTCFRANRLDLVDQIMKRMELSDTPPDIRTYNNILSHYSSFKSTAGAEQAEKILLYLRENAREKPHLRPCIVSYSIVLKAWAGSGDPRALDHMWNMYELVRREAIEIDVIFGSHLIYCLSSAVDGALTQPKASDVSPQASPSAICLQRGRMVLEEMEMNENISNKPELPSYKSLLDGYIRCNDLVEATSLVLHMVEVYTSGKNPHAKPTHHIFSLITESWIKYGDLVKATLFANKMRELYLLRQIPMGPSLSSYRALHSAWQISRHPKKEMFLAEVQSHIREMERVFRSSNRTSYPETSHSTSSTTPTFLEVANAVAAKQLHRI